MISHQHKCIFVHIPKTAGTSIERVLQGPNSKKGSDHRFLNEYPKQLVADYYKFCVVRNPWGRFYSLFNYYVKGGNNYIPPNLKEEIKMIARKLFIPRFRTDQEISRLMPQDFNTFCEVFLYNRNDFYGNRALAPQNDYISVKNQIMVDLVIKFENLNEGWEQVMRDLGISLPLEHHRKSDRQEDYRLHYNTRSIELVAQYYHGDILAHDYTFDNYAK